MKQASKLLISDMALTAVFTALITVCAFISFPVFSVPVTLQTFGVFCASAVLGTKRGTSAVGAYILLGAVGLPVFHGFQGGIGILFGSTGGFIWGFLPAAAVIGAVSKRHSADFKALLPTMLSANIILYAVGCVWYAFLYGGGVSGVLMTCVVPFLVPDVLKAVAAAYVASKIAKYAR